MDSEASVYVPVEEAQNSKCFFLKSLCQSTTLASLSGKVCLAIMKSGWAQLIRPSTSV